MSNIVKQGVPGVFTSFTDNTLEFKSISNNIGVIIGAAYTGQINVPTLVDSYDTYKKLYGAIEDLDYIFTPYAIKNLTKYGSAYVVRTGFTNGVNHNNNDNTLIFYASNSTDKIPLAVLEVNEALKDNTLNKITASTLTNVSGSFNLAYTISGSSAVNVSGSVVASSENYITKAFKDSANLVLKYSFDEMITSLSTSILAATHSLVISTGSLFRIESGSIIYSNAYTPYIKNATGLDLFRIGTIADGYEVNQLYKIEISNIKVGTSTKYPTFDLTVRDIADTDTRKIVLEKYTSLNLNPDSDFYIGKQIGDARKTFAYRNNSYRIVYNGIYPNKSNRIFIDIKDEIKNKLYDKLILMPTGFGDYNYTVKYPTGITPTLVKSGMTDATTLDLTSTIYGLNFTNKATLSFLDAVTSGSTVATGSGFNFSSCSNYSANQTAVLLKGFALGVQGGQNGAFRLKTHATSANITQGYDLTDSTNLDCTMFNNIFNMLTNKYEYIFHYVMIPGVNLTEHSDGIIDLIDEFIELRKGDFKFLIDAGDCIDSDYATACTNADSIDNEFIYAYYPWLYIKYNGKYIKVPAVCDECTVFSKLKQVYKAWNAPAGYEFGVLENTIKPTINLNEADVKELAIHKINAILAKVNYNAVVNYGQKTLYDGSAYEYPKFSNIYIMNSLIDFNNELKNIGDRFLFINNNDTTRSKFIKTIEPLFESALGSGIEWYTIQCDRFNNTEDIIKKNIMLAEISLKFFGIAEEIHIPFYIEQKEVTTQA